MKSWSGSDGPVADDPRERWSPVLAAGGAYAVSDLGRARREVGGCGTRAGRILKPFAAGAGGHLTVSLCVDGRREYAQVAVLVARAFLPPPPPGRPLVVHIDGDPANCRADNLRWTTRAAFNREHPPWRRKLSDGAIEEIRAAKGRESAIALAGRYGVVRQTIHAIWKGPPDPR